MSDPHCVHPIMVKSNILVLSQRRPPLKLTIFKSTLLDHLVLPRKRKNLVSCYKNKFGISPFNCKSCHDTAVSLYSKCTNIPGPKFKSCKKSWLNAGSQHPDCNVTVYVDQPWWIAFRFNLDPYLSFCSRLLGCVSKTFFELTLVCLGFPFDPW